jgi:hypothetical protein
MRKTRLRAFSLKLFRYLVIISLFILPMRAAYANPAGEAVGAVGDVINGVVSIPVGIIAGTLSGPPVIGTVGGALLGVLNALSLTTRGALRIVGVAIPLAASAAPYLPLFL